ncbi:MAG: 3-hydroxyacyl-CoA dehydrogenase NAD-binding domain-containing protein [Actinomycetota bacterium]|nr:3-hydroxyacyl-CoA dehydrogenase NAD-binding domain-containing protein [Actinomycetota bacterium]
MTATAPVTPVTPTAAFPEEVVTHTPVRDVTLPRGAGTMALVTLDNRFDHTRPNTLGPATIAGLEATVRSLAARAEAGEIQAVGITGKPFVFAVGADLKAVAAATSREQALDVARGGHAAYGAIMDLPVPTFAFVNGAAMGGGVEIALACDYRTISAGVPAVALPECFLGLVPGWGGCYLLPRLIGPENALEVIIDNPLTMNRMLKGPQAFALGLGDAMFEAADFLEESIRWAADVVSGATTVQRTDHTTDEGAWVAALAKAAGVVEARTGGVAPAPLRALELVRAARTATRQEAFAAEDEALADLVMGDELRAGLYAFDLVQRRAKRPAGAPDKTYAATVAKVGIVGAGLMASQLALLFVQRLKVPVVITDLDQDRVDKGVAWVIAELEKLAAKGRLNPDALNRLRALVSGSTSKDGFADADVVIEAVFEQMSVKKAVFAQLEEVVSDTCVLMTNTSSLSITQMAADLRHPERVVGFHFFNPVAVMPLVEIVKGERTSHVALATAFATGKALRKTCVLVSDSPSFIVNRLLGRFMGEVAKVVDEGTPVEVADSAFAGLAPMPPFVLLGLVGPAIALHNSETLAAAFPDRFYVSDGLRAVVAAGASGFYSYDTGRPVVDEEVRAMLPRPQHPVELTRDEVRERVLSVLADEAARMLDEGVVAAPMDLDLAMITGAGFQFWNGGLTPLLDRSGVAEKVTGQRFLPAGAASVPVPA